ncbi:Guanine nucleotide exchange factor VAV2 [Nymphon striatum]|nr:Guanine nucleotide exchange factor VAV2 [Nymphon striatum]
MAETLWHECVTWLIRCEVLPFDHRVTQPNSQVIDLANTLRDGVLLCQLLNKLVPGCIDLKEISLRPQMSQFLCLKNIRTFLQACQNVFDIHTTDLFEPYMLFDYTNFVQVLHTLSCISKSSRAESSGIRGFLPNSRSHDYYNDDIYRNLQDIANHNACALEEENTFQLDSLRGNGRRRQAAEDVETNAEFATSDECYSCTDQIQDDDIYEDLCAYNRGGSQVRSTASIPLEKRDYCIKELVETESNYIDALNMIVKHFMRPLKSVMRPEDRKVVFMHITYFAEIHTGFHSDLNKACNSAQHQISECFLHWREKFITYGDYCSNLPHAQDLVDDLCNRSEIINQAILKCQLNANDGKFKLRDLLSVPMQRVLKYHLLLKELLKHSLDTHEDYEGLEKALESMLDLSMYINEVKRDNETLQIIKDIENSITDLSMPENTELKDYGRLLKDGEMKIRSHDDNKLKNRYIFIFDKVMLMCKSTRGEQYSYKEALILRDYKVEDVYSAKMSNRDKWSHYWYLVHRQNKTAYTMYAKTEDMKHKWIEAIERALETVMPSDFRFTDHLFAMFTFEKPTYCVECNKLLSIHFSVLRGVFFQGYQCATCFMGVHKECIRKVRSCGAPSLPPRPSIPPPSSPSPSSISPLPSPLEETPSVRIGQDSVLCIVKAKQSYENNAPGHLHFSIGDFIIVTRKLNRVWWEGRLERTNQEGLFPVDSVEEQNSSVSRGSNIFRPQPVSSAPNHPENYMNLKVEDYSWFVGPMERETAMNKLDNQSVGTFLVRTRPKDGGYAISISYNNLVKHMRISTTADGGLFYLSESRYFKSVVELIKYYEENLLLECFSGLDTKLCNPFKQQNSRVPAPIGQAIANYDFSATSNNMLSLHKGDKITILSKAGGEKGWWKGQIEQKIGYFPLTYVSEIEN